MYVYLVVIALTALGISTQTRMNTRIEIQQLDSIVSRIIPIRLADKISILLPADSYAKDGMDEGRLTI